MPPDLNLLIALDVLLEEGSVVGAARRMHLSPPAMSRTLARIREAMGDPIFVQAGRRLVPTPHAEAIRGQVREAVEQASMLMTPGAQVDLSTLQRQFNVRANDLFMVVESGRLLQAMTDQMPRSRLCYMPEENGIDDDDLRSGRVDLFISASRVLGAEIRVQPLFTTTFVGLAREDHPLFEQDISAERFVRWGHIGISRRGKASGPIDTALSALGLIRQVSLVAPTPFSALFAMLDSDLLLPAPEHLAQSAVRAGMKVRQFDLPVPLKTVLVTQAWHPRHQHDPGHQWLRRTVRQLCGQ
ncbi:LysR family transcriptional regulator [Pseudomonas putida]